VGLQEWVLKQLVKFLWWLVWTDLERLLDEIIIVLFLSVILAYIVWKILKGE